MNKKVIAIYFLSLLFCVLSLSADPPGFGGDRPCSCQHQQNYYEWCTQWCGEINGTCNGEVFKWGCWCRNPGYSWICDCGYIVICYDPLWASPQFSAGCDDTYCGW